MTTIEELNQRIEELTPKTEGRVGAFGKDLGKLRERVKEQPDLQAAYEAGKLAASLPESAREQVDALASEGRYGEAKTLSALATKVEAPKPPRAGGASAAPTGAGTYPATLRELVKLHREDNAAYKRLMNDPDFDPNSLR